MTLPSRLHITLDIGAELDESPEVEISHHHSEDGASWLHINDETFGVCIRPVAGGRSLRPSPEHVEFAERLATQARIWADTVRTWAEGIWEREWEDGEERG